MKNKKAKKFVKGLIKWSLTNLRKFPWRKKTATPFEVFVAEMLLRKTSANAVASLFDEFIEKYPTFKELSQANEKELVRLLQPLGLHNRRAKALHEIAVNLSSCGLPNTEQDLLELPHTGRYVANATLCFGFGRRKPIIDTNVARIYSRVFGLEVKKNQLHQDDALWEFAEQLLPLRLFRRYNFALLDFGAIICKQSSPLCSTCFARSYCTYPSKEIPV